MKILLTGGSSFTGVWIARALAEAGHHVVATLRAPDAGAYHGVRAARVAELARHADLRWGMAFGDDAFLALAAEGGWDVLAHHAAEVGDYRSPDYDLAGALAANTRNLPHVLKALAGGGLQAVILTGSVFENDEGLGNPPLVAFSPYGLSKAFTAQAFRYWTAQYCLPFGKFVIPNPFGLFEEPRFCAYLIKTWKAGQVAQVRTPSYVRDNIHVPLLARAYAGFVQQVVGGGAFIRTGPSGYIESQGGFAQRMAREMQARSALACGLELLDQSDFSEPLVRVNTDPLLPSAAEEASIWDAYIGAALQ
ncbi:NAD-dependent epimerase/dehydratase family protein [Humitalea sp. 24SJ18S-53]|uniref:NAD-dependent epimerase/dehydratase family protein n=1 Tax=Humitalea sp. 24SJ18S-53 TaxID=3422307 RepID=UPI003D667524